MRAKQFALGMAIAILIPVVVHYAVELIAPSPYPQGAPSASGLLPGAPPGALPGPVSDLEAAVSWGSALLGGHPASPAPQDDWRHHNEVHFALAYVVGLAAIALGTVIPVPSVGGGLMFGGLFTFIDGCLFTWGEIDVWTRFIALLIALAVFVSLGVWKLGGSDGPGASLDGMDESF